MIIFWILALGGLLFLAKEIFSSSDINRAGRRNNVNAFEILQERYARGEIDRAEYEQKRRDLVKI